MLHSADVLQQIGATSYALEILGGGRLPPPTEIRLMEIEVGFLACHLPPERQEMIQPHVLALVEHDDWSGWYELAERVDDSNTPLGHLAAQQLWRHANTGNGMASAWKWCDYYSAVGRQILEKLREHGESDDWWLDLLDEIPADQEQGQLYQLGLQVLVQRAKAFEDFLAVWERAPLNSPHRQTAMAGATQTGHDFEHWWQAYKDIIKDNDGQYTAEEEALIANRLADTVDIEETQYPGDAFSSWDDVWQASACDSDTERRALAGMLRTMRKPQHAQLAWQSLAPDDPRRGQILAQLIALNKREEAAQ